ncbi:hypothetical protein Ae201684P_007794 [Aphanomyces euteiches]|uniref:RNase H type-1 domain-containing protein n=1 Tax=Aphanomyces euteiches TaxID=100861 RepID=A0A6G0XSF9_9STRA|nr:hypothetical protein Ae201684_001816 [Aphanomyces euteiches]KAH9089626.1 hypothetical protein Ae201684P_007794 [Aphanomyces euteiches]
MEKEGRRNGSVHDDSERKQFDQEALSSVPSEAEDMPLGGSLPHPQIFNLKSVPDVDQSQCDPELQILEGIDMSPEEMENQLALIPEITPCSEPVKIEDLDYGEADQSGEEKEKMRKVLAKYQKYFIQSGNGLPPAARGAVCDINVKGAKPIAQRARRVRPEHLKQLFELLKGLLDYGLITFSNSPWASPIVIVLKKGGSNIRLCIDYRAVNDLQELLLSPMPTLDCMLANFDAIQWFLSLDNASGFWVVRATKRARRISAFICPLGHFEWTRMAQGLKNAPMIYQRMISNALFGFVDLPPGVSEVDEEGEPRDMFRINYRYPEEKMPPIANRTSFADDISDGAETWDGIVELTDRILARLTHFNISISAAKSKFGKRRIEFLGRWIAQDGLSARPKGLAQLVNIPFPASLQGVQSFLGSLNFYSRFIENYSIKASSLYELSREEIEKGEVSEASRLSFEELKRDFAALPTLKHSVANQDVHVLLYTTRWAISATVCQEFDGILHPIRFCGRVLKGGEPRYEGWAKEVLALLRVLKTCFFEVRSRMLVVYTRFALLNWLLKDKQAKSENLHWAAMLAPWSIKVVQVQELDGRWNLPIMLTSTLRPPDSTTLESFELFEPNKTKDGLKPRQVRMPTITELNGAFLAAFDGSIKTSERFGAWGAIIWLLPEWKIVWASSGVLEDATVNLAEYQGAISALEAALQLGIRSIQVFGDSKLVIHQALDWMQCKQPHLQGKLKELRKLEKQLTRVDYHHVLRRWNASADHLATMGMQHRGKAPDLTVEDLNELQEKNLLAELLQDQEESQAKQVESISFNSTHDQTSAPETGKIWAFTHPKPNSTTVGLSLKIRLGRISRAQDREKRWSTLKNYLKGNFDELEAEDISKAIKEAGSFEIGEENALYRLNWSRRRSPEPQLVWSLVIPANLVPMVLQHAHDSLESGHLRFQNTYERLRRHFFWPRMYTDAK